MQSIHNYTQLYFYMINYLKQRGVIGFLVQVIKWLSDSAFYKATLVP